MLWLPQLLLQTAVSGVSPYMGAGLVPFATWTHVMATYDGLSVRIFVNGAMTSLTPYARGILGKSDSPLRIGNRTSAAGDGEFFAGVLDEVRVLGLATPRRTPSFAIHTPDSRKGCPPAAPTGAMAVTPLNLSQDTNVAISGHVISNATGPRVLNLIVDKSLVTSSVCSTPALDWCEHNLHWTVRLAAGAHEISMAPSNAEVPMGCGPTLGAIDVVVLGD